MTCPKCSGDTRVIDSRADRNRVLRRRECKECEHRFFTEEKQSMNAQLDFWNLKSKIKFYGGIRKTRGREYGR